MSDRSLLATNAALRTTSLTRTPWLRDPPESTSPLVRKARRHLRRAVALLEEDVQSQPQGGGSPASYRAVGTNVRSAAACARSKRMAAAGAHAIGKLKLPSVTQAAVAASHLRRSQRASAAGDRPQKVAGCDAADLKRVLLKFERYLHENFLRGIDVLRLSQWVRPQDRSEGPFMCWLTNSGASVDTKFDVGKLRRALEKEVENGDLKMSTREVRLLMRALDDGHGRVDYTKLRTFTTPSKVRSLDAGAPMPELEPKTALPKGPTILPPRFRRHNQLPAFLPSPSHSQYDYQQ